LHIPELEILTKPFLTMRQPYGSTQTTPMPNENLKDYDNGEDGNND
jgi:hypothetical protein